MVTRKLLNTLSAFSSSPPKSIGATLPSTASSTMDFLAMYIMDEIAKVSKLDNLNWLHTLIQSINAHYWEHHSEISCKNAASSNKTDKYDKSTKSNSQTDNRKNNSSSNNNNSGSSNNSRQPPASSSNCNKPNLSSKLRKDGKLTQQEWQWWMDSNLCLFSSKGTHIQWLKKLFQCFLISI